jgi:D-glycero-alpha-D-manno-heptose-7-phosphate kinase
LRFLNISCGVEIHQDADLPARSGMGSSSAFTVGLLHALHGLQGRMVGKQQLAVESIYLEQEVLREAVGSQDQVEAAYGGLNHVQFNPNGGFDVRPVTISTERIAELNAHLMLFYTGIRRTASQVAETFTHAIDDRKRQLRIIKDLVDEGLTVLNGAGDITAFGELLHEAWQVKRSLSSFVSNDEVDGLYARARSCGAVGGKLTGAGGGGFLLLFAPPEKQEGIRASLNHLLHVPFRFESSGSQIIYYERDQDYSAVERARASQTIQAFKELDLSTR